MVLTDHAVQCDQHKKSKLNVWFRFTLQKLQEVFLTVSFATKVALHYCSLVIGFIRKFMKNCFMSPCNVLTNVLSVSKISGYS